MTILNYQKILKEKVRIVKINSNEKKYFIRFYDFLPDKTKFNVLSFEKNNLSKPELVSTQIHPYTSRDLKSILLKTGFRELKFYGNFDGNKFQISASNDLIIECKA